MQNYEVVKELGSGNFGVARLMRHKETKQLVAMKYIERGRKVSFFHTSVVVIYYILIYSLFWFGCRLMRMLREKS